MTCTSIHQELLFSVTSDLDLAIALELIDTTTEEDLAALAMIENGATKLIDGIAKLRANWQCDVNTAVFHFMKAGYYDYLVA